MIRIFCTSAPPMIGVPSYSNVQVLRSSMEVLEVVGYYAAESSLSLNYTIPQLVPNSCSIPHPLIQSMMPFNAALFELLTPTLKSEI